MKNIKNSIKKLRASWAFRESIQSNNNNESDNDDNIETKQRLYEQMIPNMVIYKGYKFPGNAVNKRVLENIEDFDVRDDDIYLIAYPANGTHLLEDIVQALLQKHFEKKNLQQNQKETNETKKSDDNQNHNDDQQTPQITVARLEASNLYGHIRWLNSLRSPRLISTSLPYDLLPQQLQIPTAKIIYMGRNSKDHIVAYYYHHRLKGIQISLDDFIDLYLNGNLIYGNYFDHIVSYWQLSQLYQNNVLFICYEELKIITLKIVKLIVEFLELNLDEQEIEMLIVDKQFIRNTQNTMNGDNLQRQQEDSDRQNAHKVNKFYNILGDWDNYLNIDQCRRVDEMIRMKFESQRLYLTDDVETALNNVDKFSRILCNKPDHKPKSRLFNGIGINDAMLTLTPTRKPKSTCYKKLILTKDEARFIRKKDKVIIIENTDDATDSNQNDKEQSNWFSRIFCYCCNNSNPFKRRSYNQL